jgi:hypothetical protein
MSRRPCKTVWFELNKILNTKQYSLSHGKKQVVSNKKTGKNGGKKA